MRSTWSVLRSLKIWHLTTAAALTFMALAPNVVCARDDSSDDDSQNQQYNSQSDNSNSSSSQSDQNRQNRDQQQRDRQQNRDQQQNADRNNSDASRQNNAGDNANRRSQQADRQRNQYDQNQYNNDAEQANNRQQAGVDQRNQQQNQFGRQDQNYRGSDQQGQDGQQPQYGQQNQNGYPQQNDQANDWQYNQRNPSGQGYRSYSIDQSQGWNGPQQQAGRQNWSGERSAHPMLGITAGHSQDGRVMVSQVVPNSPAAEAGLRPGDEIAAVNGARVERIQQLIDLMNSAGPNAPLSLSVWRNGRMQTMTAHLQNPTNGPQGFAQQRYDRMQRGGQNDDDTVYYHGHERGALGVTLSDGARSGVRVATVFPNSPAQQAGIRPGDRLVSISGQPIQSYRDVVRLIGSRQPNSQVQMEVDRNGRQQLLTATLAGPQRVFEQDAHATGSTYQGNDQQETRFYRGQPANQQRTDSDEFNAPD
jgi:C-terminal processing protease CtpA/Prc